MPWYQILFGIKGADKHYTSLESKRIFEKDYQRALCHASILAVKVFESKGHFTVKQYIKKYGDDDVATEKFIDDREQFLVYKAEAVNNESISEAM